MILQTKLDGVLLVEGDHDRHVIWSLCKSHNVAKTFKVDTPTQGSFKADGIDTLLKMFQTEIDGDAHKKIGIVVDADENLDERWKDVTKQIPQRLGYIIPEIPDAMGTILSNSCTRAPRIGIWIMPDNKIQGVLEDFIRHLLPEKELLQDYADNILDEIERKNLHKYKNQRSKAFIYTWLAWQHRPGIPMGSAITEKALSADSPIARLFVEWLNRLFNE